MKKYDFLASLDVDAQRCFTPLCPDELPVPEGMDIVDELNNNANYARLRLGSKDAHSPKALWVTKDKNKINTPITIYSPGKNNKNRQQNISSDLDCYWPVHAVPGTDGFELIPGLPRPSQYHYFVWKGVELDMHPYGACFHDLANTMSTGLIEYLLHQKITHVVVGGLSLEFCVKTTVLQLLANGFNVIVNLSATKGIFPELILQAKQEMTDNGAFFIENSGQIVNILD